MEGPDARVPAIPSSSEGLLTLRLRGGFPRPVLSGNGVRAILTYLRLMKYVRASNRRWAGRGTY